MLWECAEVAECRLIASRDKPGQGGGQEMIGRRENIVLVSDSAAMRANGTRLSLSRSRCT